MVAAFWSDLREARKAEQIAETAFSSSLGDVWTVQQIGDIREYFHKGDLLVTNKETGKQHFIEVKDDSRIADTRNILCEEGVYYYDSGETRKGNFYSDYEYYAIVSRSENKIYVYDFSILRQIYKKGEFKTIRHYDQETDCYLLPMSAAKRHGALKGILTF